MKKSVGRPVERIQLSSISMPFRQKKKEETTLNRNFSFNSFTTILTKQKERGNGWCARRNPLIVFWEKGNLGAGFSHSGRRVPSL